MLQFSDRVRRRITLTLFAVLCAVPTLVVAAWGVSRQLPWHVRAEAQRLGWQLGMKVSIGAVEHPRPGVVRYEGLLLANPETGKEVARCPVLEATWGHAGTGPLLRLRAVQPEINAAALDDVRRLVDRVLAGSAGPLDGEICLYAESLVIRSGRGPQTFSDVTGVVQTPPQGPVAKVFFRLPGESMPEQALVYLGRDRQQATPVSVLGLDTRGSDLPCSVLALGADGLIALGPQSRFCGHLYGRETADGLEVTLWGQFSEVDLGRVLRDCFPSCRLSGSGQLHVDNAVVLDGRLQRTTGTLIAGPGEVNSDLVGVAIESLGLVGGPVRIMSAPIPFEELAVGFSLDGNGLRLDGLCKPNGSGTVLAGPQGRILGPPQSQPIQLMGLIGNLIPQIASELLAESGQSSGHAERLLRRMPVSEAVCSRLLQEARARRGPAFSQARPETQVSRARESDMR